MYGWLKIGPDVRDSVLRLCSNLAYWYWPSFTRRGECAASGPSSLYTSSRKYSSRRCESRSTITFVLLHYRVHDQQELVDRLLRPRGTGPALDVAAGCLARGHRLGLGAF